MKPHGPAACFWRAASSARTLGALNAVMDDFLDALRELFPEEVHGNVTLKSRDRWDEVAERLEWAGCPEYAGFLRFGCRALSAMETERAVSVSFIRLPASARSRMPQP